MTPAAELRAAAAKIRERAGRACGRPWRNRDGLIEGNGARVATAAIAEGHDSADHIALWHPGVAELVADWLDAVAQAVDGMDCSADDGLVVSPFGTGRAVAIARAINGEPEASATQSTPKAEACWCGAEIVNDACPNFVVPPHKGGA